jgi:hypothetical protein
MFCTKCGAELAANAKFCTKCGVEAGAVSQDKPPENAAVAGASVHTAVVGIPVALRTGLVKSEPAVILIGKSFSALVRFDKKQYEQIVASGNQGGNYFKKVAGMMNAFPKYAFSLTEKPIEGVVTEHPGSILIQDGNIKKLTIWRGFDSGNDQYDNNYSFELVTTTEKHKGTVDGSVDIHMLNTMLKETLGNRFHK